MRLAILGGCGVVGQAAARATLRVTDAEKLIIADRDGEGALRLAERLGERAAGMEVDVEKPEQLEGLIDRVDIVLNMVGPYFRFGIPTLKTAIRFKTHYVDINDDWEPTLDMLALDPEARKAGITAIIGLGTSPGLMNLMAVRAMREMDDVDTLITTWNLDAILREYLEAPVQETPQEEEAEVSGAIVHLMHQISGTIRVYQDGAYADVKPLQEVEVDYPGAGKVLAYTVGHPEPVTLARNRTGLKACLNLMRASPSLVELLRSLSQAIDEGKMDSFEAAGAFMRAPLQDLMPPPGKKAPDVPRRFALAIGTQGGEPRRVAVGLRKEPPGEAGTSIGLAAVLGVAAIERGLVKEHGVFAPEDVLDPDVILSFFAAECDPPGTKAEDVLEISRST